VRALPGLRVPGLAGMLYKTPINKQTPPNAQSRDPCRHSRMALVRANTDGTPNLYENCDPQMPPTARRAV